MPIYEYQCTACGHHFDTIQTFKDEPLIHCPVCGEAALKKLISAPAFHLKGEGWYATDFKKPATPNAGSKEEGAKEKAKENVKNEATESKDSKASPIETPKKVDKSD
jgi:putative FmdB family regulatory protein